MSGKIIIVGFDDSHDKFGATEPSARRHSGIRGVVGLNYQGEFNGPPITADRVIPTMRKYVNEAEADALIQRDMVFK